MIHQDSKFQFRKWARLRGKVWDFRVPEVISEMLGSTPDLSKGVVLFPPISHALFNNDSAGQETDPIR